MILADLDLNPLDLLSRVLDFVLTTLQGWFDNVPVLHSIGSLGLAIIALTFVVRLFLTPLFSWQTRATRRQQAQMQKLQPQITELRAKYKGQTQKFNAELQKLYRENGTNPASMLQGCLPSLLQMVIILPMYGSIKQVASSIHTDFRFLWIPNVTQSVHDLCCKVPGGYIGWFSGLASHPEYLIIPLLAALGTFLQARIMIVPTAPTTAGATPGQPQSMQGLTNNITYLLPIVIFVTGVSLIQGLGLYWVTQSAFMVAHQYYLVGWGGLSVPHWFPGAHRVTDLTYEGHRETRMRVAAGRRSASAPSDGSGVAVKNGHNIPAAALVAAPDQPRTRAMSEPTGSPTRDNKGSAAKKRRR